MCNSVETGGCGNASWLRNRESWIQNGNTKSYLRIAASHLFASFCVGNQRVTLCFTSSPCGRRNCDHWQHRFCCLAVTTILGHVSAVGEQEIDSLGTIH